MRCVWCGADLIAFPEGIAEQHEVVESDANLCPGSGRPGVEGKVWVLPMTPDMIVEQEWRERVMTPTAAEVDALIAAFDEAILPQDDK